MLSSQTVYKSMLQTTNGLDLTLALANLCWTQFTQGGGGAPKSNRNNSCLFSVWTRGGQRRSNMVFKFVPRWMANWINSIRPSVRNQNLLDRPRLLPSSFEFVRVLSRNHQHRLMQYTHVSERSRRYLMLMLKISSAVIFFLNSMYIGQCFLFPVCLAYNNYVFSETRETIQSIVFFFQRGIPKSNRNGVVVGWDFCITKIVCMRFILLLLLLLSVLFYIEGWNLKKKSFVSFMRFSFW